jgi:oligosaccharide repeat unit polymerase
MGITYIPLWHDNNIFIFDNTHLEAEYYLLHRISYISLLASFMMFFSSKSKLNKLIYFILIYVSISVQSKRSIIAIAVLIIVIYLIYSKKIKPKYQYLFLLIAASIIILFSIRYMLNYRSFDLEYNILNTYTQMKFDFMRDDRIRSVLYVITRNDLTILDYPGQSYVNQILSLFPLEYIIRIPIVSYNVFYTSAMLGLPVTSGSGYYTTSFLDELIANFSLIGAIIGPIFVGLLARSLDKMNLKNSIIAIVGIIFLLMLNLSFIMWYLQFWFIITIIDKNKITL